MKSFNIDAKFSTNNNEHGLVIVWDLYHLMADYYSKTKDKNVEKVCMYYMLDLCVTQNRPDSWAGLALHKATLVEQKLDCVSFSLQ